MYVYTCMYEKRGGRERYYVPRKPWLNFPSVVKLYTKPWPSADAAKPAMATRIDFITSGEVEYTYASTINVFQVY